MNAQTAQRTAGPWHIQTAPNGYQSVVNAKGDDLCTIANAAFIVRACNAHDELVAALRELLLIAHGAGIRAHRLANARDVLSRVSS